MSRPLVRVKVHHLITKLFSSQGSLLILSLILQLHCTHGVPGFDLSKSMSYTAMTLAHRAGLDEREISAAAMLGGSFEEDEDGAAKEVFDGTEDPNKSIPQEETIPPITESMKAHNGPVLPLCCSMETEDIPHYRCGTGISVSLESVNSDASTKTKMWSAPAKLVSTKTSTDFRLEKSVLSCHYATFAATISLKENTTEGHFFYPDGNLKFENEFYRINEYCISSIKRDKISLQICQSNCSDPVTPCIHKCCGLDEIYSFGDDGFPTGCQPIASEAWSNSASGENDYSGVNKWSPILYHNLSTRLSNEERDKLKPHYIQRYPSNFKHMCKSKKTTVFPFGTTISDYLTLVTGKPFNNLEFRLRKDGWLLYPFQDSKGNEIPVLHRIVNYCVDGAQHYGESTEYMNDESQSVLFLCSGGVDEAFENNLDIPESEEILSKTDSELSGSAEYRRNMTLKEYGPTSAEIYAKNKKKQHVLYQLFQLNSHSRPANIVLNHNVKKLTKIKTRRPSIISLFPNHPNRTKIVTRKIIKKPKYKLPVCCTFPSDVNDGQTYHCKNRMIDLVAKQNERMPKPIWNVPDYFMTNGVETSFTLEEDPINCSFGQWQLQGFIHNFQLNATASQIEISSDGMESGILSDGYLKYENEFYRPEEFCINGLSPRIVEVMMCRPNCKSKSTPCISKCCGWDEVYSLGLNTGFRGCYPMSEEKPRFQPTFFRNFHYPLKEEDQKQIRPHFIQRYPPTFQDKCYKSITLAFPFSEYVAAQLNPESDKGPTFKHLAFRFRGDGKLMYSVPNPDGTSLTALYDREEFCVDLITDYGSSEPLMNHENHTILFICASQPNTADSIELDDDDIDYNYR